VGANLQSWHNLVLNIANIHLNDQPDIFRWVLTSSGQFSVSSMYMAMMDSDIVPHNIFLWKLKIPLKVKVFLWLLYRKVILTKDNLLKRNWQGATTCCFCHNNETIHHLFIDCDLAKFTWRVLYITFGLQTPSTINHMFETWILNINGNMRKLILVGIGAILWGIWLSRNDVIFDKSSILSYMQVIYRATHWTRTWSIFQKEEDRQKL
jgi:hypothetical protein